MWVGFFFFRKLQTNNCQLLPEDFVSKISKTIGNFLRFYHLFNFAC
jgi:hypothetical protein